MNVQEIAKILGESGCYFLSLLRLTGHDGEAIGIFAKALRAGLVEEDGFVKNPSALLSMVSNGTWDVRHEPATYQTKPNEKEILRFERKVPMKTYAHFVVGDGTGKVYYDPLGKSQTVQYGTLQSKRIVKQSIG